MLIELLIAQMCVGYSGVDHEACYKAAEATLIEAEVSQSVKSAEHKISTSAQHKVTNVAGKEVLAISLFAAKAIKDKEVSGKLTRNKGFVPSTNVSAGKDSGKVSFGWEF